jgi:hypothetical protein
MNKQVPEVSDWIVTMLSQRDVTAPHIYVRVDGVRYWDNAIAGAEKKTKGYDGIAAVIVKEEN